MKFATEIRNARLNAIEATIGEGPILEIRDGELPAAVGDGDSGNLLVSITLPADWMNEADLGSVTKFGSWTGTAAEAGTATYFRIKSPDLAETWIQGSVSLPGDGGEMILDNTNIAAGQAVAVSAFVLTDGNA